jgi:DNA polymerase-3 subunit delta'
LSWQRIRGHDVEVEAFRRAVQRGRLAHAYLFAGPTGVGKRLFAVELAKALLCESRPPGDTSRFDACDGCPACIQIEAGAHPDFFGMVRPPDKHEFPIELMRELCQAFALKTARGRGKVVLLDDADDLNQESANCFLKTLEEPPLRSVLILIGSTPDRQLATIVSRCQIVRFAPLPGPIVDELLSANEIEDAALRKRLVSLSGGSVGLALTLADPALLELRRRLIDTIASPRFDPVALAKEWHDFCEKAGKETAEKRSRATLVLRLLIDFLTDALAVREGGTSHRCEAADAQALGELTRRTAPAVLMALIDRCLEADEQLDRYIQISLVLEGLLDAASQKLG